MQDRADVVCHLLDQQNEDNNNNKACKIEVVLFIKI